MIGSPQERKTDLPQLPAFSPRRNIPPALRGPVKAALVLVAVLVAAGSTASFTESYRALYDWARHHGLGAGLWAAIWPLQIDVFIAIGELALFIALAYAWPPRSRAAAWAVTLVGLAVSVAGNVGHAIDTGADRLTAAVPPLAAAFALAVALGILKRTVNTAGISESDAPLNGHDDSFGYRARELFADDLAAGRVPTLRELRRELAIGQARARRVQAHLRPLAERN